MAVSLLTLVGAGLLWTLLALLSLLLLLLLLLLFVPLDLQLRTDADLAAPDWEDEPSGAVRWRLRLRWGKAILTAGLTGQGLTLEQMDLRLLGLRLGGRSRQEEEGTAHRPGRSHPRGARKERKRGRPRFEPALLRALAEEALSLPRRLWASLGIRLEGEITYGFSDPSLTGSCEAIRWGTGMAIPLRLTPDFLRPCLIGWAEMKGRLYGFRLVALAWRLARNPTIWNHLVGKIRFRPLRTILMQGGS